MARWSDRRISRRALARSAVGAAGASAGVSILTSAGFAAPQGQQAASAAPIGAEPLKVKRAGVGLRAYDPERAWPGYTLFAPPPPNRVIHLIDMEGTVVHSWEMPYPPGLYGYLTDRGTLFYNGQIRNDSHLGQSPFMGGVALEMDWTSRVLWEVQQPEHHHDGSLLRNGNVIFLCATELPPEVAARVQGGRPGTEYDGDKINADYLRETTTDGRVVWEWRSWEHMDPADYPIAAVQDDRDEWTHGNAVIELPDGNLMVSFRNLSTIVTIDRRSGDVIWRLGAPPLSGQHAPVPLENGNILIFDNGPHRLDESFPYSRVIEVDPATKEIVWKYQERPVHHFFSSRISNARRLPNGNTLINEGLFGRFFEVTAEGDVVWEYVNPYFGGPPAAPVNQIFRVHRYSEEEIARARGAASG